MRSIGRHGPLARLLVALAAALPVFALAQGQAYDTNAGGGAGASGLTWVFVAFAVLALVVVFLVVVWLLKRPEPPHGMTRP